MLNVLILLILFFSYFLVGGLGQKKTSTATPITPPLQCCDGGDGPACQPVPGKTISYNSPTGENNYGLLISHAALTERAQHIVPASPQVFIEGHQIFLNDSQNKNICEPSTNDCVWDGDDKGAIPDDMLIYVCLENCVVNVLHDGVFDVYVELSKASDIPDVIKNCKKPSQTETTGNVIIIPPPASTPDKTLQLKALIASTIPRLPWISPHCKPAIYLYPEEKTDVQVQIAPKGKLTLTIPNYPTSGWNVVAYPDGKIETNNTSYDYLYYETEIPDTLIEKPTEGFVLTQKDLLQLFSDVLPKLGLNEKETMQFSEYWLKALPKSPHYFVGIISPTNLNSFSPITINPVPNTIIRVTLYFELLEETKSVKAPTIVPVNRNGFTAVEWGGIVKTDPLHPFSCFM